MDRWLRKDFLVGHIHESQEDQVLQKYTEILQYVKDCSFYNNKALQNWSDVKIADPWIIATACCYDYVIVTNEIRNGNLRIGSPTGKIKIPDVADHFEVPVINLFDFQKQLNFKF